MSGSARQASLAGVVRAWSDAVTPLVEVRPSGEPLVACLTDQLHCLVAALAKEPFTPAPAAQVAATLVERGLVSEQCLVRTVVVLGSALSDRPELAAVDGLAGKIATLLGILAYGHVTARQHRAPEQGEAWFRGVFDSAPVGMLISDLDGTVTQSNSAWTELLHYPPAKITGHDISELFGPEDAALLDSAYRALKEGRRGRFQGRVKACSGKGDTTWVSLTASVLRDALGNPTHHVTMIEDVHDRHLLELRMRHQSLHDLLTGLPNRLHFGIYLEGLLEGEPDATVVLCKINLDCFGIVNDGLGIGIGDLLLRSVACRLQALVAGEHAFLARFGADEFAIAIKESPATPDTATLAARINAELSEPVYLADRGLAVSACVGIVRRTAGQTNTKELIRAMETTLHQAKRTGRGQWALYDPAFDAQQRTRYELATSMPAAWENGQVTLRYQPLVRVDPAVEDTGRTVALAALLRWDHPGRAAVDHDDCITLAEQTGLVLSIGPWMLRRACEQLQEWRERCGVAVPPVRVDLTTNLIQDPDLVAVVRSTLAATGLRAADVQLGMPVETIVAGHGDTVDNVRTLAEIGVCVVFTHYGQALGNLVLLESLPVQVVELASSLVRAAGQRPDSVVRSAVACMMPLIRRAGAAVVMAGVDDPEQAYWWGRTGADSARGAAFAQPVAPQDVPELLASQRQ